MLEGVCIVHVAVGTNILDAGWDTTLDKFTVNFNCVRPAHAGLASVLGISKPNFFLQSPSISSPLSPAI